MRGATSLSGRLAAHRPLFDRLMFFVALFGVLVVVHLWLQADRGFNRGCLGFSEPDPTFNCEAVTQSDASTLFGVSNVFWGLLFYLALTAISFAVPLVADGLRYRLKQLRAFMVVGGVAYSSYLVYYQAAEIGEYCLLCLMSAGTVMTLFVILLLSLFLTSESIRMKPMKKVREFTLFASLSVLVLVLVAADVTYFNSLPETDVVGAVNLEAAPASTPAPLLAGTAECGYSTDIDRMDNYMDLISFTDPYKGNFDAKVTVIEFFDLNCPHCRSMHPVMQQIVETNKDKARFYYLPYVISQASIAQTEALYMAAQEGKYFEMLDLQFARQKPGGLNEQDLRAIATALDMNADVMMDRLQRGVYRAELKRRYDQVAQIGITGVPAVMINGQVLDRNSRSVECINTLIDQAVSSSD